MVDEVMLACPPRSSGEPGADRRQPCGDQRHYVAADPRVPTGQSASLQIRADRPWLRSAALRPGSGLLPVLSRRTPVPAGRYDRVGARPELHNPGLVTRRQFAVADADRVIGRDEPRATRRPRPRLDQRAGRRAPALPAQDRLHPRRQCIEVDCTRLRHRRGRRH